MTPQQIKRAKRLAEILGLQVASDSQLSSREYNGGCIILPDGEYGRASYVFNPEQDKSLLLDLQVKYEVIVDWWKDGTGVAYIESKGFTREWSVDFDGVADLPAALIDCVIEINGGYDE